MNISLAGKYAVICGSTQGIGFAAAKELVELGANCILIARNKSALEKAMQALSGKEGQKHRYVIADFSNREQVSKAAETIVNQTQIEILVNNA